MSGIMCAMVGSGGEHVFTNLSFSGSHYSTGFGSGTATVWFYSDGSETGRSYGSSQWYSKITTGIGSYYWISTNSGAWVSLATTQYWSLTGTNASASYSIRVASDSAGTNIVGSGTIQLDVSNGA